MRWMPLAADAGAEQRELALLAGYACGEETVYTAANAILQSTSASKVRSPHNISATYW